MTEYRADYEGIGDMLNAPWMVATMLAITEKAEAIAVAAAPVYEKGPHPGQYKAAFSSEAHAHGGPRRNRAVGILSNSSPEALFVEYGTRNNEARHILRDAMRAAAEDA